MEGHPGVEPQREHCTWRIVGQLLRTVRVQDLGLRQGSGFKVYGIGLDHELVGLARAVARKIVRSGIFAWSFAVWSQKSRVVWILGPGRQTPDSRPQIEA